MDGVRLVLHAPVACEIVLPGDGNSDHFSAAGGKRRLHGCDFVDNPPGELEYCQPFAEAFLPGLDLV